MDSAVGIARVGRHLTFEEGNSCMRPRQRTFIAGLALASLLATVGCTGSPYTVAMTPDFEVMTPEGVASVSIRQSLPNLTDAEFQRVVMTGMAAAMPGRVVEQPVSEPYPTRRIVWHVNPTAAPGVSRLSVNVFDGATPVAYEQDTVSSGAPRGAITQVVASLTTRLVNRYARLGSRAGTGDAT
jgi:hypothetical protein